MPFIPRVTNAAVAPETNVVRAEPFDAVELSS